MNIDHRLISLKTNLSSITASIGGSAEFPGVEVSKYATVPTASCHSGEVPMKKPPWSWGTLCWQELDLSVITSSKQCQSCGGLVKTDDHAGRSYPWATTQSCHHCHRETSDTLRFPQWLFHKRISPKAKSTSLCFKISNIRKLNMHVFVSDWLINSMYSKCQGDGFQHSSCLFPVFSLPNHQSFTSL